MNINKSWRWIYRPWMGGQVIWFLNLVLLIFKRSCRLSNHFENQILISKESIYSIVDLLKICWFDFCWKHCFRLLMIKKNKAWEYVTGPGSKSEYPAWYKDPNFCGFSPYNLPPAWYDRSSQSPFNFMTFAFEIFDKKLHVLKSKNRLEQSCLHDHLIDSNQQCFNRKQFGLTTRLMQRYIYILQTLLKNFI